MHIVSTRTRARWALRGFRSTSEIELIALLGQRKSLISSLLLEPVVQLMLLAAGLQGAMQGAPFTDHYMTWVFPGLLALQTVRAFSRTMYRMVLDRQWGMLTLKRLAGTSSAGYTLGKIAPSAIVLCVQMGSLFTLVLLLGSRFAPLPVLGTVVLALIAAIFWSALAIVVTGFVRDYHVRDVVVTWVMLPLSMAAPVFYPIESAPTYLQWLAKANPLTYQVEGMRDLLLHGQFDFTGGVMLLLSMVMFPLAVKSISHGDALSSQSGL